MLSNNFSSALFVIIAMFLFNFISGVPIIMSNPHETPHLVTEKISKCKYNFSL